MDANERSKLPMRVETLQKREASLVPDLVPYPSNAETRGRCVDCIYRLSHALNLSKTTPFAATRVFDRYMIVTPSIAGSEVAMRLAAAAAVDIVGKCVDLDSTCCGHIKAVPVYRHHVTDMWPEDDFVLNFAKAQMRLLEALDSDPVAPTPHEYISECSPWFDPWNAARDRRQRPAQENVLASATALLCDAFVHEAESLKCTCWEIAGIASYSASESARTAIQATDVVTPALQTLWQTIPWSKSVKVQRLMRNSIRCVFNKYVGGGLARYYPGEYYVCNITDSTKMTIDT